MQRVEFDRFGPAAEVCRLVEAPDPPAPGPGEVAVAVEAFPINPVDLLTIAGEYAHRPALPAVPGSEGAGRITAVGPGVDDLAVGDRVMLLGRENWQSAKTVPAAEVVRLPDGGDLRQFCQLKVNPATAALMLRRYRDLAPGDWVLQNAANSAVGRHVIRLARAAGVRSCNIVRRDGLIGELTDFGADAVVVDGPDLADRVAAATGGAAIALALDAVAGPGCTALADCLADGGTIVTYGLLSGRPCELTPHQVVFRGITLTGFWLVNHLGAMSAAERAALYGELAGRIADGTLEAAVEAVYPLAEVGAALARAAEDGRSGKILVAAQGAL